MLYYLMVWSIKIFKSAVFLVFGNSTDSACGSIYKCDCVSLRVCLLLQVVCKNIYFPCTFFSLKQFTLLHGINNIIRPLNLRGIFLLHFKITLPHVFIYCYWNTIHEGKGKGNITAEIHWLYKCAVMALSLSVMQGIYFCMGYVWNVQKASKSLI